MVFIDMMASQWMNEITMEFRSKVESSERMTSKMNNHGSIEKSWKPFVLWWINLNWLEKVFVRKILDEYETQ